MTLALLLVPFQPTFQGSTIEGESGETGFVIRGSSIDLNNAGAQAHDNEITSHPISTSKRSKQHALEQTAAPLKSDAGAEAVFQYSWGCFSPDDQQFDCIYDTDPDNPQGPAKHPSHSYPN